MQKELDKTPRNRRFSRRYGSRGAYSRTKKRNYKFVVDPSNPSSHVHVQFITDKIHSTLSPPSTRITNQLNKLIKKSVLKEHDEETT